jgi:hypothetical protein
LCRVPSLTEKAYFITDQIEWVLKRYNMFFASELWHTKILYANA